MVPVSFGAPVVPLVPGVASVLLAPLLGLAEPDDFSCIVELHAASEKAHATKAIHLNITFSLKNDEQIRLTSQAIA